MQIQGPIFHKSAQTLGYADDLDMTGRSKEVHRDITLALHETSNNI